MCKTYLDNNIVEMDNINICSFKLRLVWNMKRGADSKQTHAELELFSTSDRNIQIGLISRFFSQRRNMRQKLVC